MPSKINTIQHPTNPQNLKIIDQLNELYTTLNKDSKLISIDKNAHVISSKEHPVLSIITPNHIDDLFYCVTTNNTILLQENVNNSELLKNLNHLSIYRELLTFEDSILNNYDEMSQELKQKAPMFSKVVKDIYNVQVNIYTYYTYAKSIAECIYTDSILKIRTKGN